MADAAQEQGSELMGCSANEMKELEATPEFDKRITRVKLRELLIKAKIYSDTWNDEQRRKINVQKCAHPTSPLFYQLCQLMQLGNCISWLRDSSSTLSGCKARHSPDIFKVSQRLWSRGAEECCLCLPRLEAVDCVKESQVMVDLIQKLDRGQPIFEAPPERPAGERNALNLVPATLNWDSHGCIQSVCCR